MQCAQSNDKFGYAGLRSEEVTGGTKMKARIAVHSRTNADLIGVDPESTRTGFVVDLRVKGGRCAFVAVELRRGRRE